MNVGDIMTAHVHTVHLDDKLELIREILADVDYHHLLVEEDNKLVGIISDRDVLRHQSPFLGTAQERAQDRELLERNACSIMTPHPITVETTTSLDEAAALLLKHTISCLPVVSFDQSIEGVITWKDILRNR